VLTEHGISPEEDTQYYRFLLKLSLDPDPDWWVKYEREKQRVAAAGGLGGRSPLRSAVTLVGQSASVTRSAMRKGPSPYGQPPPPGTREDATEFARDLRHVRRRVMDEYAREREGVNSIKSGRGKLSRSHANSHRKRGVKPLYYDDAYEEDDIEEEDPAERGYADFKLTAAAFRVWIRHASSLRALRTAREAAVENWMISVSFWECNALKRALARWRARHNVMQLHALRFWYGENLRNRFRYWKEHTYRLRAERAEEAINVRRALAAWTGKSLSYCFAKWRTAIADTNDAREDVLVVASAQRRARMLRAWSAEAARNAALDRLGGDVEAQAAHRRKVLFYVKWRSAFHERARRREIMQRMGARIRNRALSGALTGWRAKTSAALEQKALLAGIAARFRNRRLVASFNTWSEKASSASLERDKLRGIAARLMHGSATRCLRAWRDLASEQARLEGCASRWLRASP
jgi:protein SFI1